MGIISKTVHWTRQFLQDPDYKICQKLLHIMDAERIPDRMIQKYQYHCAFGHPLNLRDPKTFNEKLQWLKLYDRKPQYSTMVDKIAVKEVVEKMIGKDYIIPTLAVYSNADEIDLDKLPDKFVLKCNHDSGSVVICRDKSVFDLESAKAKLGEGLKTNYYLQNREWPYKNVTPKIFAEAYLEDDSEINRHGLTDYKFTCFNGTADNVMVCCDRQSGQTKFYFFDRSWKLLPLNKRGKGIDPDFQLPKPECIDEMFNIAGKLSEGIPFLRVDLYCIGGRPFFGETTFYPTSGLDANLLPETELLFGERIILPKSKIKQ